MIPTNQNFPCTVIFSRWKVFTENGCFINLMKGQQLAPWEDYTWQSFQWLTLWRIKVLVNVKYLRRNLMLLIVVIWSFCLGWMSYEINVTFVFPFFLEKIMLFSHVNQVIKFVAVSSFAAWCQSLNKKLHICLFRAIMMLLLFCVKCHGLHCTGGWIWTNTFALCKNTTFN